MKQRTKRHWRNEGDVRSEIVAAGNAGRKWRRAEDAVIIGTVESVDGDIALAQQLGRTPDAVRARRYKLKKAGKM